MTDLSSPTSRDARLRDSRQQFLANLDAGLEDIHAVLERLSSTPDSKILREGLTRRMQAMHSACTLLGFDDAGKTFQACASRLASVPGDVPEPVLERIRGELDPLPGMFATDESTVDEWAVSGHAGAAERAESVPCEEDPTSERASCPSDPVASHDAAPDGALAPLSADDPPDLLTPAPSSIGFADFIAAQEAAPDSRAQEAPSAAPVAVASKLQVVALTSDRDAKRAVVDACLAMESDQAIACRPQVATTQEQALHLARTRSPEVVVVDMAQAEARAFIHALHADTLCDPTRLVLLVDHLDSELPSTVSDFVAYRALAKPVSVAVLRRALTSLVRETPHLEPTWDGLTIERLSEVLCDELRHGLRESVPADQRDARIDLGGGGEAKAAIWEALARVRRSVARGSEGRVSFVDQDPMRGVPMLFEAEEGAGREHGRGGVDVSLEGRRIIVIDDDPAIAWFLSGALRNAGAEVIEAHHGARGLELVYEYWPDLVLCDILMPEIDGFSLCRRVKTDLALSDVPVVLVSWKEDLLQRVRELGSDADGYIRKEASAPAVVRRACEVLQARARIERRIASGAEVLGRLDGLTPRLILELCCSLRRNARVVFNDASKAFVAHVVDGELRSVEGRGTAGDAFGGERALGELLGLRVARFEIGTNPSREPVEFSGTLREVVGPAVVRARALGRLFESRSLERIARIGLNGDAGAGVLPQDCEGALNELDAGKCPQAVAARYGIDTVARLLADLTRRGAIATVLSEEGDDLLVRETEQQRARRDALAAVPDFDTPLPGDEVDVDASLSELPPLVAPVVAARREDVRIGAPTRSELRSRDLLFSLDLDTDDSSLPLMAAPPVERPSAAPAAPSTDGAASLLVLASGATPETVEPLRATVSSQSAVQTDESVSALDAPEVHTASEGSKPSAAAAHDPRRGSVDEAPPRVEPVASTAGVELADMLVGSLLATPDPSPVQKRTDGVPLARPAAGPIRSTRVADSARGTSPGLGDLAGPERAAVTAGTSTRKSFPPAERQASLAPEPIRRAPSVASESAIGSPAEPFRFESSSAESPDAGPLHSAMPQRDAERDVRWSESSIDVDAASPRSVLLDAKVGVAAAARAAALLGKARASKVRDAAASLRRLSASGVGPAVVRAKRVAAPVAMAAVAAALAFGAVRTGVDLFSGSGAESSAPIVQAPAAETNGGGAEPQAEGAAPPAEKQSEAAFAVSELDLPEGVPLANGKGLLEVSTGGSHKIYVEGVFVGAGPVRRVPVPAGAHTISVRLDGEERTEKVEVAPGRRTRVSALTLETEQPVAKK